MSWKSLVAYRKQVSDIDSSLIQMFDVPEHSIIAAEARIGREFPKQLKEIWRTIGYGFISGNQEGTKERDIGNMILEPEFVADAMLGENTFSFYMREERQKGFPFCYAGQDDFMVLSQMQNGEWIVCDSFQSNQTPIANSVGEFLDKLLIDPNFHQI